MTSSHNNIYTIPASVSFSDSLVEWLIENAHTTNQPLSNYLVLLPTRRACRTVQEAFLRKTDGEPLLLPRLHPLGDVNDEELMINTGRNIIEDIPPAIPAVKRQIMLTNLISKLHPDAGLEQNMQLAKALMKLMDQVYTEDLDLSLLPKLVEEAELAENWKITTKFLDILSDNWPDILTQNNYIDEIDRRNRLLNTLNNYWQNTPPNYPIIAAGSTASIPATAKLLQTISNLPKGVLIIPGLDKQISNFGWNKIDEGHPQYTLKKLIGNLNIDRHDIQYISDTKNKISVFEKFMSHAMAPPEYTNQWQKISLDKIQINALKENLKSIKRYDCDTAEEEAQLISLIIRETIETQGKTIALVTPDRYLARRAAIACKRWNITVDDSSGIPLKESRPGTFLKLIVDAYLKDFMPLSLLSLLKHELSQGNGFNDYRSAIRRFDIDVCRGIKQKGFKGYKEFYQIKIENEKVKSKPSENTLEFIKHLETIFAPLIELSPHQYYLFDDILQAHLTVAESLASGEANDGSSLLWQGEAGNALSVFLSDLRQHSHAVGKCTLHEYKIILDQFISTQTVRPRYGMHPRVMILGQMEARLMQTDTIILSGLNEGVWPANVEHDPWMSRPMRDKFGLPKPERDITLSAHDFVQNICGKDVYITRAKRQEDAPTMPARWLQRIDTLTEVLGLSPDLSRQGKHLKFLKILNKNKTIPPIKRPAPTPPITARPTKMSVTKIEKWRQDPYAIYAQYILGLYKLQDIEPETSIADRGTIIHSIMEIFVNTYPKELPQNTEACFIDVANSVIDDYHLQESEINFWMPRLKKLSRWITDHESIWRQNSRFLKSEIKGNMTLSDDLKNPFILEGIIDRIDLKNTNGLALIDYKSAGTFNKKSITNGDRPQLPLEAMIAENNGFMKHGIKDKKVDEIAYWIMTGAKKPGEVTTIRDETEIKEILEITKEGLLSLIRIFEEENTPYYAIPDLDNAPRFNDYMHLERVKEWASLNDEIGDVA